jgi:coatomer subunit delta
MERGKLDKGGYSSISGPRVIEKTFSDMSISGSGFGSGSGLGGLSTDMDSFASKPKGKESSIAFLDKYFILEKPNLLNQFMLMI